MTIRALAAGIPYDDIGETKLREIERRWRAKELEVFMHGRTQVELKLMDMSARSLGEAEDETEDDPVKLKEKKEKHARWETRGAEIKAEIRESLMFSFSPDHMQAAHVYLHGMPGEEKRKIAEPLEGVSQQVARSFLALIRKQTFSRGEWARSQLWAQLREGDARARLEATAGGRD